MVRNPVRLLVCGGRECWRGGFGKGVWGGVLEGECWEGVWRYGEGAEGERVWSVWGGCEGVGRNLRWCGGVQD